jgi:hypothetical protein
MRGGLGGSGGPLPITATAAAAADKPAVGSEKATEKEKVLENVMRRRLEWEEWTAGEHVVEVRGVAWRFLLGW